MLLESAVKPLAKVSGDIKAKENHLHPFTYLKYLFEQLPNLAVEGRDVLDSLLLFRIPGTRNDDLNLKRRKPLNLLEGRLFVQFVALIYLSYLKKTMKDQRLFGTYTIQGVLNQLDSIECFECPGCALRIGEITTPFLAS